MNDDLTYDIEGMQLTEEEESLRLVAYPDPGTGSDPWTIGYGHTGDDVQEGLVIDRQIAENLLRHDVREAEVAVKRLVTIALVQNQYDALVDFTFNCGAKNLEKSTLLKLINEGDFETADKEFAKWVKGGGHILKGLVKRRYAEAKLFAGDNVA